MADGPVRVGFIGAGRIADLHALAYHANERAELYAVCDTNARHVGRRADEWGAGRSYTDYQQLLADTDVDAVEILTPHQFHQEMSVAALAAGKHVSLQKPMARTLEEADRIIEAAKRSDRVFRVFENYRYYPPYVRAKEMLDAGEIGDPVTIRIKVIGGNPKYGWIVPMQSWAWRLDEAQSGGGPSIFDHGYHIFSIAMWLFGDVEEVFAWIERTEIGGGIEVDTPSLIAWKHRDRVLGSWETVESGEMMVRSKYYSNDEWIEITGTKGVIWVTRCTGQMLEAPPLIVYRDGETRAIHDLESDWASSFVAGTNDWIAAIRGGGQPELAAEDGRAVLRFSLAAHLSANERRLVCLAELG